MAPKKAAGKKKKIVELQEPEHSPTWERAVESGIWDRPPTMLPDANTWPTWGALRERVLTATTEINILGSATVRDAFVAEVAKLSPPELSKLLLRGSTNLTKVTLSPLSACPKLQTLDLSGCSKLRTLLIQSSSLTSLNISGCSALTKVLIQCPNLERLKMADCTGLKEMLLWSDKLTELDATSSKDMTKRVLYCPNLLVSKLAVLLPPPRPQKPVHLPIAELVKDQYDKQQRVSAQEKEGLSNLSITNTVIAAYHRPLF
eukprot:jgi/Astpho2/628/fgenesh1_pm.00013_%23_18_t